jgi:UDP-N-acetylglucosamine 1-carboxyvinyltransferase
MSEIRKKIGQLIRNARKEQGLTRKELGERLVITEAAVHKYESGRRNLSIEILNKIARAMRLKLKIGLEKL